MLQSCFNLKVKRTIEMAKRRITFNRGGLSRANIEISEKVPNSSFPDPLIKSEGMPPIAVEGRLDRGIQYRLKSKTSGFPLPAY
jgi:hypothetical protein